MDGPFVALPLPESGTQTTVIAGMPVVASAGAVYSMLFEFWVLLGDHEGSAMVASVLLHSSAVPPSVP